MGNDLNQIFVDYEQMVDEFAKKLKKAFHSDVENEVSRERGRLRKSLMAIVRVPSDESEAKYLANVDGNEIESAPCVRIITDQILIKLRESIEKAAMEWIKEEKARMFYSLANLFRKARRDTERSFAGRVRSPPRLR